MSDCFLDTSNVADTLRGRAGALVATAPYQNLLVPVVAWGELVHGAHKSHDPAGGLAPLAARIKPSQIIGPDQATAHIYGEMLAELEWQGQRIPSNDLWIAAAAVRFGLPLVARDAHFGRLPRLCWVTYQT